MSIVRLGSSDGDMLAATAYLPGRPKEYYKATAQNIAKLRVSEKKYANAYDQDILNKAATAAAKKYADMAQDEKAQAARIAQAEQSESDRLAAEAKRRADMETAKKVLIGVGVGGVLLLLVLKGKKKEQA